MTINELKSLLSRYHIRPDKSLGQNFLLSEKTLDEIISAAELEASDTVLEIGPGLGVLTQKLAEVAGQIVAIEKDRKLTHVLRKIFKNRKNVRIVNDDALFFDFGSVIASGVPAERGNLNEIASAGTPRNDKNWNYKLVANIPYYITGKLLQNVLSEGSKPTLAVLLLQKEVAERIVAGPGKMSILAVSVQFYADAEIVSFVSKENFYPVPEVDSAVVKLRLLEKPRFDVSEKEFFRLVKIGFSNRRKQLQNNLVSLPESGSAKIDYKTILESLGLNPLCRAQDLSLENWVKLYEKLPDRG